MLKRSGLSDHLARAYVDRLVNDPGGLAGALRWYRAMPLDLSIGRTIGAITEVDWRKCDAQGTAFKTR